MRRAGFAAALTLSAAAFAGPAPQDPPAPPAAEPPAAPAAPAAESKSPVDRALDLLASTQGDDGTWADAGHPLSGARGRRIGRTSLALLACFAGGETHVAGAHAATVKKGLRALCGEVRDDGAVAPAVREGDWFADHVLATQTLCEWYGLTQSDLAKPRAIAAVAFLIDARAADGGWGSGPRAVASNAAATSDAVIALRTAELAGLLPDRRALDGALAFLGKCVVPGTGRASDVPDPNPAAPKRVPAEDLGLSARVAIARVFAASDVEALRKDPSWTRVADRVANRVAKAKRPAWPAVAASAPDVRAVVAQAWLLREAGGDAHLAALEADEAAWFENLTTLLASKDVDAALVPWSGRTGFIAGSALAAATRYRWKRRLDATPATPK